MIQRLNADAAVWRFKAEVMAHVRSVEQQYWNLAQAHVQLWSSDRAVSLAQEILNREQAELVVGRGTIADVAEAAQRLEQFNLDLVTRTSDVITTERQLRNILGLPPADNRRIIPVTPPTEARLEPDWETSLAQMLNFQPDIVQQQLLVRVAELQLLIARNQLLPQLSLQALYQFNGLGQQLDSAEAVMTGATLKALNPVIANMQRAAGLNSQPGNYSNFTQWQIGFTFQAPLGMRAPLANTRSAQYALLRARAYMQQIVHQTTHSLARFFLEIDANYKQFKTASRLRAAAALRLESQRAYYEEGRITIDRFLDAVSQYATAVATEAQYKTTYNISIVALEEAKGTLLAYDNIAVAEGPHPSKAYVQARDIQAAHRRFRISPDGPEVPQQPTGPLNPDPAKPTPPPGVAPPKARSRCPPLPARWDRGPRRCHRIPRQDCCRSSPRPNRGRVPTPAAAGATSRPCRITRRPAHRRTTGRRRHLPTVGFTHRPGRPRHGTILRRRIPRPSRTRAQPRQRTACPGSPHAAVPAGFVSRADRARTRRCSSSGRPAPACRSDRPAAFAAGMSSLGHLKIVKTLLTIAKPSSQQ